MTEANTANTDYTVSFGTSWALKLRDDLGENKNISVDNIFDESNSITLEQFQNKTHCSSIENTYFYKFLDKNGDKTLTIEEYQNYFKEDEDCYTSYDINSNLDTRISYFENLMECDNIAFNQIIQAEAPIGLSKDNLEKIIETKLKIDLSDAQFIDDAEIPYFKTGPVDGVTKFYKIIKEDNQYSIVESESQDGIITKRDATILNQTNVSSSEDINRTKNKKHSQDKDLTEFRQNGTLVERQSESSSVLYYSKNSSKLISSWDKVDSFWGLENSEQNNKEISIDTYPDSPDMYYVVTLKSQDEDKNNKYVYHFANEEITKDETTGYITTTTNYSKDEEAKTDTCQIITTRDKEGMPVSVEVIQENKSIKIDYDNKEKTETQTDENGHKNIKKILYDKSFALPSNTGVANSTLEVYDSEDTLLYIANYDIDGNLI